MGFYLRFEGVNLEPFLHDAEDLSVSRGGGLALLNAPDEVLAGLRTVFPADQVSPVNLGASSGLFRIELDPEKDAGGKTNREEATDAVNGLLRSGVRSHATFVVTTVPDAGDPEFLNDRRRLIASNRWTQMQSQSLIYPATDETPFPETRVCGKDQVRPVAVTIDHWDPETNLIVTEPRSRSVHDRHEYGHAQKSHFFRAEIKRAALPLTEADPAVLNEFDYARDLNRLAGGARLESGELHPLNDKIAMLYVDGNRFGRKFAESCTTPDQLNQRSSLLRKEQAQFLTRLMERIRTNPEGWIYNGEEDGTPVKQVRIEVLLWGGDELLIVVPAWKGLALAQFFFEQSTNWDTFPGLSHAAGLVFCNRKCHIHRTAALAKDLAELCKQEMYPSDPSRSGVGERNLLAYQVLESFDHLGRRPDWRYLLERYPLLKSDTPNALLLPGEKLGDLIAAAGPLRDELPRRKLHEAASSLMSNGELPADFDMQIDIGKWVEACRPTSLEPTHTPLFQKAAWLHLQELWDYVAPDQGGI